jgi:hypothetical protein
VLLVGQSGNTAFSWNGEGTVWELLMHGHVRGALSQAGLESRERQTTRTRVLAGALRNGLRASILRRRAGDAVHPPSRRFLNRPPSPRERLNEYALPAGSREMWVALMTTPRHAWSAEPVLQWGVEQRDPTADRRLLERLLQYPQAAFRIGGRARGLARTLAAGLLPDRVRLRSTQGAQVPEAPSLIALHADRYRAALDAFRRSSCCRELLDIEEMSRALEGFVHGERDYYLALGFDRAMSVGLFLSALEGEP